ncbi:MAG: hypothetical protein Q8L64_04295 [bacterium]|nr:hypothetical protein [bacterium]
MNINNTIITAVVIALIVLGAFWVAKYAKDSSAPNPALTAFAQCIASKGLTMYGAEWCSHCKAEKARFGAAFSYVPYVECPENTKICLDKGINGYPTWVDAAGTKYEGQQGLERLAEISGCEL